MTDLGEALANPELAVLSAVVHGDVDDPDPVARSTLDPVRRLDEDGRLLNVEFLASQPNPVTRRIIEGLMDQTYAYQSEFARHFLAVGKAEGKAEAILTLLRERGVPITDAFEVGVRACTDIPRLERWFQRAIHAVRAEDVLADD